MKLPHALAGAMALMMFGAMCPLAALPMRRPTIQNIRFACRSTTT
jgi:hypothetical protein